MDKVSGNTAERNSGTRGYHAIQTSDGPRVTVLNRIRNIVVRMDLNNVPLEDLRWEGRGDRLLLFWTNHYVLKRGSSEEFRSDRVVSLFARAVSLPCDVDFANVVRSVHGSRVTLRLPKQELRPAYAVVQSTDRICQRNRA